MMIPRKQAEEEFLQWFDSKKLPKRLLETKADDKENIVSAIEEGYLVLNEENQFVQTLRFPKEVNGNKAETLVFNNRVTEGELAASTKGLKPDELIGQMPIAYVSCLTGKNRPEIRILDTTDLSIGKSIASFFSI